MKTDCRVCGLPVEAFMSFGKMPIANGFLRRDEFADEYFFELQVASCPHCGMFQLIRQPEREKLFHAYYPFYSSTSSRMTAHFRELAEQVQRDCLSSPDPLVVEIGSNDGIMLKHFAARGIRHVGIEPSANVAQAAIAQGIHTVCEFFDQSLAERIVREHGQADVFLGANVMCHIADLNSVAEGIAILLRPGGRAVFEDPYLGDVIEQTAYDQIYDEHVFLFSVSSIRYLFEQHGMEVVDIEPQKTHGGSMRYTVARQGVYPISRRVLARLKEEQRLGLNKAKTYEEFRRSCARSRRDLRVLLHELKQKGKRIVGYAATSKSTTVINYCQITPDLIEFISDTTPIKQGKYSPGAHIPVRPHREFQANYPDYALLFAWNHAEEIMEKEGAFRDAGGKWIVYVPKVRVLE